MNNSMKNEKIANMFSGVDPKKLEDEIKKAEALSRHPNMNGDDKKRLINEILSPDNAELIKLIKNNL